MKTFMVVFIFFFIGSQGRFINKPPPHEDYVKMARYLVHNSDWVSLATISTISEIKGFPFANVVAIADSGKDQQSTGKIYFMLTTLDYTAQDLMKDNRLTMLLSMEQDKSCSMNHIDAMEPTCARIMLSGSAERLEENTDEYRFGNESMYSRHPSAKNWNIAHKFFLCKMNIKQIAVLDWYGGPHYVNPEDYYKTVLDEDFNLESNEEEEFTAVNRFDELSNDIDEENNSSEEKYKEITIKIGKNSHVKNVNINY